MACITLLNNVGPHNIIVGCWESSLNMSLPTHLFKHPTYIELPINDHRVGSGWMTCPSGIISLKTWGSFLVTTVQRKIITVANWRGLHNNPYQCKWTRVWNPNWLGIEAVFIRLVWHRPWWAMCHVWCTRILPIMTSQSLLCMLNTSKPLKSTRICNYIQV